MFAPERPHIILLSPRNSTAGFQKVMVRLRNRHPSSTPDHSRLGNGLENGYQTPMLLSRAPTYSAKSRTEIVAEQLCLWIPQPECGVLLFDHVGSSFGAGSSTQPVPSVFTCSIRVIYTMSSVQRCAAMRCPPFATDLGLRIWQAHRVHSDLARSFITAKEF